jgi:hypothetical protein
MVGDDGGIGLARRRRLVEAAPARLRVADVPDERHTPEGEGSGEAGTETVSQHLGSPV